MADETKVEAVCTWGEAEDVTLVGKHTMKWDDRGKTGHAILLEKPEHLAFKDYVGSGSLAGMKHGYCGHWHLALNAKEAKELGHSLLRAAARAHYLDVSYGEWIDPHNERGDDV